MSEPIEHFETQTMTFRGMERSVLVATSDGPPVILMHEIFGMTATVAAFAEMIRSAGFKVYLPVLFGSTKPKSGALGKALGSAQFACVAHQFRVLAQNESGPWADWLRDLVDRICTVSGAERVGVIGLCLTGNFVLSMAQDPRVKAPVMGEPSLPGVGDGLHVTKQELDALKARTDLDVRAYRYRDDTICRPGLFARLETELGTAFTGETLDLPGKKLHSVFTEHLRDEAGNLRHGKVQEVIDFLHAKLD